MWWQCPTVRAVADGSHSDPNKITVGDWLRERLAQWVASGVISPKTTERYTNLIAYHRAVQLDAGLRDGIRHELIRRNVAAEQRPPKVIVEKMQILSADQVIDLAACLDGDPLAAPAQFAVFTGVRRGELLALTWGDTNLDRKVINVVASLEETATGIRRKAPKTEAGKREITLPDRVVDILRAHRRALLERRLLLGLGKLDDADLVFPAWDGSPWSPDAFSSAWTVAAKEHGLNVSFHALRHTHASQLIDAGVDVVTIARRLGHSCGQHHAQGLRALVQERRQQGSRCDQRRACGALKFATRFATRMYGTGWFLVGPIRTALRKSADGMGLNRKSRDQLGPLLRWRRRACSIVEGRLVERLAPGRHAFWTVGRKIEVKRLDLRPQAVEITAQEMLTKDRIALRVTLTAFRRIADPERVVNAVPDVDAWLYRLVQFAIRESVASRTLDEVLSAKNALDAELRAYVRERVAETGIEVTELGVKDVILPGEIRELVNKVVEAERTAKANLIRRQEETAATRSLLNTAKLMEENPLLLRLKELESIERLVEKVGRIDLHAGDGAGFDALLTKLVRLKADERPERA